MKCPQCLLQTPGNAKFCVECGKKLEVACPSCGHGNSPDFKFCAECGEKLSRHPVHPGKQSSLEEKLGFFGDALLLLS
jgi:hypothetical protein